MYNVIQINEATNTETVIETGLTLTEANYIIRQWAETTDIYYMARRAD